MHAALRVLFTFVWMLTLSEWGRAQDLQNSASQLLLLDNDTDTILFEKQSDITFFRLH